MVNIENVTDCSQFTVRNDFNTYISSLSDNGIVDVSLVETCKKQICIAIWGEGNPDISGIGMIVGFILDHAIGLFLAIFAIYVLSSTESSDGQPSHKRLQKIIVNVLGSFHDCSTFLCFSIQIAATVVLIKEEAGISTQGMGDGSVRITEAISLVSLLPLLYAVVLLRPPADNGKNSTFRASLRSEELDDDGNDEKDGAPKSGDKYGSNLWADDKKRFGALVSCWLLAFFPFYCKMNNVVSASKTPTSSSSAGSSGVDWEQFGIIQGICFAGVIPITDLENNLMTAMAVLSYVPLSVFVLGRILVLGLEKHHPYSSAYEKVEAWRSHVGVGRRVSRWLVGTVVVGVPVLGAGLIWTVIRVQKFQTELAVTMGAEDSDSQWTFGQVVACTVFAPVLFEGVVALKEKFFSRGEGDEKHTGLGVSMNERRNKASSQDK